MENLSDNLRKKVSPIWRAIHDHECVLDLGQGKLDTKQYQYFLIQDYLYLEDYGKALALAALKAKSEEIRNNLLHAATSTLEQEKGFIRTEMMAQAYDISTLTSTIKSPTIQAYTDYLVRTASQESFGEIIAIFLVCNWNFYEIGQRISNLSAPPGSFSARWKERYTSPFLLDVVNWYKNLLDSLYPTSSYLGIRKIEKAFFTASYYEYRFWNAVKNREQWESFDISHSRD